MQHATRQINLLRSAGLLKLPLFSFKQFSNFSLLKINKIKKHHPEIIHFSTPACVFYLNARKRSCHTALLASIQTNTHISLTQKYTYRFCHQHTPWSLSSILSISSVPSNEIRILSSLTGLMTSFEFNIHFISGWGSPSALHVKTAFDPNVTSMSTGFCKIWGFPKWW